MSRKPKSSTQSVAYPDKQHGDETGIKKQEEKRRKVLKKQEMAVREGAEEEAVPDVASSLHELKRQKGGEAGWDFSDEEQFSDDQEERFDFDDQLENTAAQAEDQGMPVGEEVAEADDEDQDVHLSSFGEEVEVLLKGGDPQEAHDSPALAETEDIEALGSEASFILLSRTSSATHSVELTATGLARVHQAQRDQENRHDGVQTPMLRRQDIRDMSVGSRGTSYVTSERQRVRQRFEAAAFTHLSRRDVNGTHTVEVEDGAVDTATDVVNELSSASTPEPTADITDSKTEPEHPEHPEPVESEEPVNLSKGILGQAGRPGLVFAGMYGNAGSTGQRGATGPAGPVGPSGPAGASVVGHAGPAGTPGTPGSKGKLGALGAKGAPGHAGTPGGPPPELDKWTKLLDYYTEIIYRMESAASTHVRGFKREASMLQQRTALFKARTDTVNNRSAQLHRYMVDNYKRMVKSVSSAREVDGFVEGMPLATSMSALHEAQQLYPAYLGTQRVATAMHAAAFQRQQQQQRQHFQNQNYQNYQYSSRKHSKSAATLTHCSSLYVVLAARVMALFF
ncbi:COL6A6 [Symbiodinium natans]|uniref:COL6A6 protein n=1 Tax=Symbiodinium natans TaxID=878477 RepID=A0A812U8J7_9DINO|nr:COL6A6 [Symbiodinium natans]